MTPEEKSREEIDAQLAASGWVVQTKDRINLAATRGVAICELSFATGEPDYTLFVDGKAIGTVEAKPEGRYTCRRRGAIRQIRLRRSRSACRRGNLRSRSATRARAAETFFTNRLDPDPRSRRVFSFHRPETLLAWVQQEKQLAQRLREFPPLAAGTLWPAQIRGHHQSRKILRRRSSAARSSRWPPARARPTPPSISSIAS